MVVLSTLAVVNGTQLLGPADANVPQGSSIASAP